MVAEGGKRDQNRRIKPKREKNNKTSYSIMFRLKRGGGSGKGTLMSKEVKRKEEESVFWWGGSCFRFSI